MQNDRCYEYTQNRELSWLRFDRRVLEEAGDKSVPLLERLKFTAIFSSNLDEFFMVRVGSLCDIAKLSPDETDNKSGLTAAEQLEQIYAAIPPLIKQKRRIYSSVRAELDENGIRDLKYGELSDDERKFADRWFEENMLPILSPIIIGSHHPIPHLANKQLIAAALLKDKKGRHAIGMIPVPESLPAYLRLPDTDLRFIRMEELLTAKALTLFGSYSVSELCVLCVTRNADLSFDEEKFEDSDEDFSRRVSKLLKKRDYLAIVRLELDRRVSDGFRAKLAAITQVGAHQIYVDECPLNMRYVFGLAGELSPDKAKRLGYPAYSPRWPEDLSRQKSMIEQVQKKDRLLFYPYDSVEPFLKLLGEAAVRPDVLSIKITIYRLASLSKIAQTLCRAAENGKEVLVMMELRARFDEANNIAWSKLLEEAGCQVIYGEEGYKCHSKICLITLRGRGKPTYITQVGTGNYNEKTNAMYTDLCLMTASERIGEDTAAFFRNMLVSDLNGGYNELSVSPMGIKNMICRNIDEQIKKGSDGYVCIKANAVTEREVIDKLCEASRAGVEIQMIIRGICCILPGVPGYTDNIRITSIVGRYLEHARIYRFGRGADEKLYIGSSDLMTRNLTRRVEIACPVYDPDIKEVLRQILSCQLRDTTKASMMLPDGSLRRKQSPEPFDSQSYFMEHSTHKPFIPENFCEKAVERLSSIFKRRR